MIKIGYWNIRGLAQPVRYLLAYSGVSWEDVLYKQAGPTAPIPFDKSCWFDVKDTLGLSFPNLPYLIDETRGVKLTQSQAIIRYVCKLSPQLHLLGEDLESQSAVDMLLAEYSDCKGRMTGLQYAHGIEGPGGVFITGSSFTDLPATLGRLSSYLGSKPWFVGSRLTVADFVFYEYLTCATLYHDAYTNAKVGGSDENCLSRTPNLQAFTRNFESLPMIAAYLASDRFEEVRAMNNHHACFR